MAVFTFSGPSGPKHCQIIFRVHVERENVMGRAVIRVYFLDNMMLQNNAAGVRNEDYSRDVLKERHDCFRARSDFRSPCVSHNYGVRVCRLGLCELLRHRAQQRLSVGVRL
jgi:hypothetical protein